MSGRSDFRINKLSGDVQALSALNLHDARFITGSVDAQASRIRLRFVTGDLQRGYETLDLDYHESDFPGGIAEARRILCHPGREVLSQRLLRRGGQWIHSLDCWPTARLEILFSRVRSKLRARRSRKSHAVRRLIRIG